MTLRPIGSVWEWYDGSLWEVLEHCSITNTNTCICISGDGPIAKYYGKKYDMYIKQDDAGWRFAYMTSSKKLFTDKELEELLV